MPNSSKNDPEAKLPVEEDAVDIREAYPLMDAVARQQGWDDPEMDSYDSFRPAENVQED